MIEAIEDFHQKDFRSAEQKEADKDKLSDSDNNG